MRTVDQFNARIKKTSSCWLWTGARGRGGYGHLLWQGKYTNAHRVAYEVFTGPIPDGLQIDHLCRNRACVNPEHLEAVTRRENLRRSDNFAGREARQTHCRRGHEFTPQNTYLYRGMRFCRTCRKAPFRADYRKRHGIPA